MTDERAPLLSRTPSATSAAYSSTFSGDASSPPPEAPFHVHAVLGSPLDDYDPHPSTMTLTGREAGDMEAGHRPAQSTGRRDSGPGRDTLAPLPDRPDGAGAGVGPGRPGRPMQVTAAMTPAPGSLPVKASRLPLDRAALDPFENETPWSCYEVFKTIVVGVTLFPIRVVLLILAVSIGGIFCYMSACCLTFRSAASNPMSRTRILLKQPMRVACRVILWSLGFWWVTWRKAHRHNMPGIIVSNHISLSDVFFYVAISKISVASLPIVGRGAMAMQTIFIDRTSADSRQEGLDLLRARAADRRFPPTLIFPEGTTTNGKCLIDFKRGAFVPGVTVLPVVIRYPSRNYNPADTGRHSGNKSLFWLMLQFYNTLEVVELAPHVPSAAERADPLLFARNVQQRMADALRVPTTSHSYHDFYLVDIARAAKVPQDWTLWDCRQKYGVTSEQVTDLLRQWRRFDRDRDGLLTLDEAMRLLAPHATAAQQRPGAGIVLKACLAAHRCSLTRPRAVPVPADWAAGARPPTTPADAERLFDFPTVIHVRALMQAHEHGFGGATAASESGEGGGGGTGFGPTSDGRDAGRGPTHGHGRGDGGGAGRGGGAGGSLPRPGAGGGSAGRQSGGGGGTGSGGESPDAGAAPIPGAVPRGVRGDHARAGGDDGRGWSPDCGRGPCVGSLGVAGYCASADSVAVDMDMDMDIDSAALGKGARSRAAGRAMLSSPADAGSVRAEWAAEDPLSLETEPLLAQA